MNNPDGDPTPRTMAQLQQAISNLREIVETRFNANDKAIDLLQNKADSQPTPGILEVRLDASDNLNNTLFRELKERTVELANANNKSLDLALQSAEKAVTKSEAAVNKQIDAIVTQMTAVFSSLEKRVTTMEAGSQGSRHSYGVIAGLASLAIAAISLIVVLSKVAS